MAWTQIMPVRMNTTTHTLSGSWTVPDGVTSIATRLIMDQADLEAASKITISIVDGTTGDPLFVSSRSPAWLVRYGVPSFRIYRMNPDRTLQNLGGLVLDFAVDTLENLRFGAEMEVL